jgi:hypothetical protein
VAIRPGRSDLVGGGAASLARPAAGAGRLANNGYLGKNLRYFFLKQRTKKFFKNQIEGRKLRG